MYSLNCPGKGRSLIHIPGHTWELLIGQYGAPPGNSPLAILHTKTLCCRYHYGNEPPKMYPITEKNVESDGLLFRIWKLCTVSAYVAASQLQWHPAQRSFPKRIKHRSFRTDRQIRYPAEARPLLLRLTLWRVHSAQLLSALREIRMRSFPYLAQPCRNPPQSWWPHIDPPRLLLVSANHPLAFHHPTIAGEYTRMIFPELARVGWDVARKKGNKCRDGRKIYLLGNVRMAVYL